MSPLLEARDLSVSHGQLEALHGVSVAVGSGEVLAMVGANGAGKSTLLRTMAGFHRPSSGRVALDGEDLTALAPQQRVRLGLVLVPEGRRLFGSLTVEENLLAGTYRARKGPWDLGTVFDLFPWMAERRRQRAWQLSGGEQQAVAIARALLVNPKALMLDEASLGLSPVAAQRVYEVLPRLTRAGLCVLLVEQDVRQALRVADRVECLLEGRVTLQGTPAELTVETIEAAYFGVRAGVEHGPRAGRGPRFGESPGVGAKDTLRSGA